MVSNNVVSFEQSVGPKRKQVLAPKERELVAGCRMVLADTLPRLQQDLFEHLDDDLYELADKSSSDALQTRYFEAMREFRKLRKSIEQGCVNGALRGYDDFWQGVPSPNNVVANAFDEDELSLVDDLELEEDLAVNNIASKADNRYHRELFALNQRFAVLLGKHDLDDDENPLAPIHLASAFRQALSRWDGDVSVKLVVYKLFDRHVMQYIGGMYDEANDLLIAANILPKVVQRTRRNPVAPSVQRAKDPSQPEESPPSEDTAPQANQQELLGVLSQLLESRRVAQGSVAPAHLPVVPANEVVGALNELQNAMVDLDSIDISELQQEQGQVRATLVQQLGIENGENFNRRFGPAEQDVIDVISMLFEYVLDDRNLPDAMKALISRLQIPMLKVAILDRAFFASKNHPARHLLNALARAAVGWTDDGDRSPDSLYGQLEGIVARVLADFSNDVSLFTQLDEQFAAYLKREEQGAEVAEERVMQVNKGQDQLKIARERVRTELNRRLAAAEVVPESVRDLLVDGWRDVLLLALLREGEDSDAWNEALVIVERLLWSVKPKPESDERQRMLKDIPDLLRALRDGFTNISYDQHKAARLFKELQACHIAALRGKKVASTPEPTIADDQALIVDDVATDDALASQRTGDQEAPKAADLQLGQWLEWDEDGKVIRGKLSWKSEVSGTYVFVNRKGMKLRDMTGASITELLRSDRAKILAAANEPLMDRALDAMVDALRNPSAGPAAIATLPA